MRRVFAASAGLAAGLVVSLVLVTPGGSKVASEVTGPAEQPSAAAPAEPQPVVAAAQQAAAPSSGVPTEGIKVHGRWTIEVRNTDGTLASRTEFNNALAGGANLSRLLARMTSVGKWVVTLMGPPGATTGPCGSPVSPIASNACLVTESGSGLTAAPSVFETLTVSVPGTEEPNEGKFVLRGTATARENASVGTVATRFAACAASIPPSTPCNFSSSSASPLTSTTLATPIAVSTDQQIQVTVVISFQ